MMIIETKRVKIYPISDNEMERLIGLQTSDALIEAYQQMLDGCRQHPQQRQWYALWNIELNDGSNVIVGNLSFKGISADGVVEIGYGMDVEYQGQGLMTEAVTAVTKWASSQQEVKSIEAETEQNNVASQRVLAKSGFVPNGKIGEEGPRFVWINND